MCVCVRVCCLLSMFVINCSFTLQVMKRLQGIKQMSVPRMSEVTVAIFTRQKVLELLSTENLGIRNKIKRCWGEKYKNTQSN